MHRSYNSQRMPVTSAIMTYSLNYDSDENPYDFC